MPQRRAETFADRLPPVATGAETDISHLSDDLADVLYPGRRQRSFRIGLEFEPFEGADGERAADLARRAPAYEERSEAGVVTRHRAAFDTAHAASLRELFGLVGDRPGTEVLVDGRRVPYARELWLPLFWLFVGVEE